MTLVITGVDPGLPFTVDNPCSGVILAPGATCQLTYTFVPTQAGAVSATDVISVNGQSVTVTLSGTGVAAPPASDVSFSSTTVSFGNVGTAEIATLPVTLTNTSGGPITVLAGTTAVAAPFALESNDCALVALAAGEGCTISYRFTPTAPGSASTTTGIVVNGETTTIVLSGTGEATISFGATTASFGSVPTAESATAAIVLTNGSSGAVSMNAVTTAVPAPFELVDNACSGIVLATSASCAITYRFSPTAPGTVSATTGVTLNGTTTTITLTGAGEADLGFSTTTVAFGEIGTAEFDVLPVVLTNTTAGAVAVDAVTTAVAAPFSLESNDCSGITLASGGSCSISYRFTPTATGFATATTGIEVDGATTEITLTGTGEADIAISPTTVAFGSVATGGFDILPVTLTNNSSGAVNLQATTTAVAAPFQLENNGCFVAALAVGATCEISYRFAPTAAGPASTTTTINVDGMSTAISLTGTGTSVATVEIGFSPTTLDFGSVGIGTSNTQPVTVTNNSADPITLDLQGVGDGDVSPFGFTATIGNCQGATLNTGDTCQIQYTFTPTSPGGTGPTDTFTVNNAAYQLSLFGNGVGAVALSPGNLDFGSIGIGTSNTQPVTITNNSADPITLDLQGVGDGDVSPFGFTATIGNCQDATLNTGDTCQIQYTFTPTTPGGTGPTDTFTVNNAAYQLPLFGNGVGAITLAPTTLDFGSIGIGTSNTQPVTVTNNSVDPITLDLQGVGDGDVSPFGFTATIGNCQGATLNTGDTCQIQYTFSPTSPGGTGPTDTFTVNNAAYQLSLFGNGVGAVALSPGNLDFGSIGVGTSHTEPVTVTNSSVDPITLDLQGVGDGDVSPFGFTATIGNCQGCHPQPR